MAKNQKVGICSREIIEPEIKRNGKVVKKAVLGPLLLTDGALRSAVKSALYRLWSASRKRIFMERVRFKGILIGEREVWCVKCEKCKRIMGISEKAHYKLTHGGQSKKKRTLFDVDHLTGSPGFDDMEQDLGRWAINLFYGELRILCRECHLIRTKIQGDERK